MRIKAALLLALHLVAVLGFEDEEVQHTRMKVKEMFRHGYDNYMQFAFPQDELQPLSCQGMETWGGYSLTLVDSLDTLVVMGEIDEFNKRAKWVWENIQFSNDVNVSVFETNIRVLGGLLAAHLFYEEGVVDPEPVGYEGQLLDLAADLGYRLLPAFDTDTGIPYGTVNFVHGVPRDEIQITSTASGGTFLLEFTMLGRLVGDTVFEVTAKRASVSLFERRSALGLVGNHINITSGEWTHKDAGIGSGIDSFYEYLFKAYMLFGDIDYWYMFNESRSAILKWLHKPPWYVEVHMFSGATVWPIYNSLQSFWPGVQAMAGNIQVAKDTVKAMHGVWRRFGAVPEGFNLLHGKVQPGQSSYPLRPELAESLYYIYQATGDPLYLHMGRDMVYAINTRSRTVCGFATLADVETGELEDRMESFFLSETLKYLYLLFDEDNQFTKNYVFTTEGHPLPIRATYSRSRYYRGGHFIPQPTKLRQQTAPQLSHGTATKKEMQCPRLPYWKRIGVSELEVRSTTQDAQLP